LSLKKNVKSPKIIEIRKQLARHVTLPIDVLNPYSGVSQWSTPGKYCHETEQRRKSSARLVSDN
jgi:hypothetical protein